MRRISVVTLALLSVLPACTITTSTTGSETPVKVVTVPVPVEPEETTVLAAPPDQVAELRGLPFSEFLEASYAVLAVRNPEELTALGISDWYGLANDRLNDLSLEFADETAALETAILEILGQYDRAGLPAPERVSYDAYEWYLQLKVDGHRFRFHDYPLHYFLNGYGDQLLRLFQDIHPLQTWADAEDYVARLSQIDRQVGQLLEGLRAREAAGVVPPNFVVSNTIGRLQNELGGNTLNSMRVESHPLYERLEDAVQSLGAGERGDLLLAEAITHLEESFVPSWVKLIDHLQDIRPLATSDEGVWRLPDGDEYYAYLLRVMTSTELTADEIHNIGLAEVDRIQDEIRKAAEDFGLAEEASVGEIREAAARQAGFMDGSDESGRQEILDYYADAFSAVETAMETAFSLRPQAAFEVIPEQVGAGGYYVAASVDGSRPGTFHAGVGGSSIPRYNMATIAFHEAIPGHHYQIALAQELDLPSIQRFITYNAHVEGWALYAERLAWELGMYEDDPAGNIGRLELELLRAIRLVADTGIHSLEWTRDEARSYITQTMGDSSWSHEADRYVLLPAQATGYLIGQLAILHLRQESSLDLRSFHDALLGSGNVPLSALTAENLNG